MDFSGLNFTMPRVHFGAGRMSELPDLIAERGKCALLVTGKSSFRESARMKELRSALAKRGVAVKELVIPGEPSPGMVDEAVAEFRDSGADIVAAVGGGSVLDAAKAVAGLLPFGNSVLDHLEGVGRGIPYTGPAMPFIAVPTTAGTGSEATKNAVLSEIGPGGYKKSFRHDTLVPQVALVDPELLASCPPDLIAANGMDALTQLLESYVSTRANPLTDALALSGLTAIREALLPVFEESKQGGPVQNTEALSRLAYASFLSGVTLAHAGLGSVHGMASPLGAYFPVPHGAACGIMTARAAAENIRLLRENEPEHPSLEKYGTIGLLFSGRDAHDLKRKDRPEELTRILGEWTERLELPGLSAYGISPADLPKIAAGSFGNSMQTNPVKLTEAQVESMLHDRL